MIVLYEHLRSNFYMQSTSEGLDGEMSVQVSKNKKVTQAKYSTFFIFL